MATARRLAVAGLAGAAWLAWSRREGASLEGAAALVTGGSRGLGFLLARELLEEGCAVAICARDEAELERARGKLSAHGRILALRCDVADADDVERMVEEVVTELGGLDVVINNAAIIQVGPLGALTAADIERALAVNFWGMVHTTLSALPHLRHSRRPRIANITSIGGKVAPPHLLPYDCAKSAAVAFSEGLTAELAGSPIRVTTVVPGLMRTGSPMHVEYRGRPEQEYRWFAAGDLLPVTAIDAADAAARIVLAIRRGEVEVTLGWQARLLRTLHGVAPGLVVGAMRLVNRTLPGPGAAAGPVRGTELRGGMPGPLERWLDEAGERANQVGDGAREAEPVPAPEPQAPSAMPDPTGSGC